MHIYVPVLVLLCMCVCVCVCMCVCLFVYVCMCVLGGCAIQLGHPSIPDETHINSHTHTHTHSLTHTHTHTYRHTQTHSDTHTYTLTQMNMSISALTHTNKHSVPQKPYKIHHLAKSSCTKTRKRQIWWCAFNFGAENFSTRVLKQQNFTRGWGYALFPGNRFSTHICLKF